MEIRLADLDQDKQRLSESVLVTLSRARGEPDWMLDIRLRSFAQFEQLSMPSVGGWPPETNLDQITVRRGPKIAERAGLRQHSDAGVVASAESELVFRRNSADLEQRGIIFCDMESALREHPELVRHYFGRIVQPEENKFSALNSAVWAGGSFVYVPPGLELEMPLQVYSRADSRTRGQFERTLIVADEGSVVHYIEGCSAPVYTADPLQAPVVEVMVSAGASVTHTAIQNWSSNVLNLVTKRAIAESEGHMEWIDANIGGRVTVDNPAIVLSGPRASGRASSVSYAGRGQQQHTGATVVHRAPETKSSILSKSIVKDGGRSDFGVSVHIEDQALGCESESRSEALVLDDCSAAYTNGQFHVLPSDAEISREEETTNIPVEQLFYLMSRGLSEEQAIGMVVNGFVAPITRTLPIEYAVEWSRLIELQMEGSIG